MTPAEALREKLDLAIFPDELFAQNCYLLRRRDTCDCLLIDPGLQHRRVLQHLEKEGLQVALILLTHGHVDHIAGVPAARVATGAPIAMHPDDRPLLEWDRLSQLPFIPASFSPFEIDIELQPAGDLAFQDLALRVLHTPGHTEGSVCFHLGLDCFVGDTLFQRSIGRTDLPGGDPEKIIFSIRNVLYRLPPKTVIYPGHGPKTTIEEEILLNPFVPGFR